MAETQSAIRLLNPRGLRPHEAVVPLRAWRVLAELWLSRSIQKPILVDLRTGVILDGHHRWWASKRLGLGLIPCYCVDYLNDTSVVCESWRPEIPVSKERVLEMAACGEKFPPQTSKHLYTMPIHEPYPLQTLR
jgi:hypothetical protein